MSYFEIFRDKDDGYRYRLVADNGEIVASSESYDSDYNAERGAADLVRNAINAQGIKTDTGFSIDVRRPLE